MILKSIKLQNIRSYLKQEIIFPEGSILLSGDIGSGKSTILLSIEFALFGIRRKHLSGLSLLRSGKNNGSVELSFEIDGKDIIVKRTLKRQRKDVVQDSGYIIINGIKKEGTAIELKTAILGLLGYPKELLTKSKSLIYRYTVYTPQEEMKKILLDDNEDRLDTLRKVFGIDKYKKIRENCFNFLKRIKSKKNILNVHISDLEEKNNSKKEKQEEIKAIDKQLKIIKEKLTEIITKHKEKKDEFESLNNKLKELSELKNKLEINNLKLSEKVNQRNDNNAELEQLSVQLKENRLKLSKLNLKRPTEIGQQDLEKEIARKEEQQSKDKEKIILLREQISYLKERLDTLKKEIGEKTILTKELVAKEITLSKLTEEIKLKDNVKNAISEIEKGAMSCNDTIKEFEVNLNTSSALKEKISRLNNCPTCLQPVTDGHKKSIITDEDEKIRKFESQLKTTIEKKKTQIKNLEKAKADYESLSKKENLIHALRVEVNNIKKISEDVITNKKLYNLLLQKKEKLDIDLDSIKIINSEEHDKKKDLLEKLKLYNLQQTEKKFLTEFISEKEERVKKISELQDANKKDIGKINLEKLDFNSKIKGYVNIEIQLKKSRSLIDELHDEEKELEIKKESLTHKNEMLDELLQSLKKEIDKKQVAKSSLKRLSEYQAWLENHFIMLMFTMEKQIMATVFREFNDYFQKWFDILVEDENLSARLNDDFSVILHQNGYDISIEHLSGGEKTAVALGYRLALNKVINDVVSQIKTKDIIILDEPTDGFSSEQLDKIREVLEELSINQVVLVSHETKIESFVQNVIRINKNEHISELI